MDKAAALLIDALFARAAYRQLISRDRNINVLGIDAGQVGSNNQLAAIDEALERRSAALLAGRDDITALFTLRDAGTADGLSWVEAAPKAQDTGFERVRLGLNGQTLAAMELYDQLGGHTLLRFSELKPNASISPDLFKFVPPKGADVIEDAPEKAR